MKDPETFDRVGDVGAAGERELIGREDSFAGGTRFWRRSLLSGSHSFPSLLLVPQSKGLHVTPGMSLSSFPSSLDTGEKSSGSPFQLPPLDSETFVHDPGTGDDVGVAGE